MSDKIFLKEITLPILETGENETYSFVQTDADLDTAGDAADAKAVGDEISDLKQDLEGLDVYTLGLYPQIEVEDTAVASFTDGADDIPVKSLTVDITPVQDLHGQANPYPGGGGKNLIPMTVDGIKAVNTAGTWSGNAWTKNGVTFTILTDSAGNVTGVNVNGTASDDVYFHLAAPSATLYSASCTATIVGDISPVVFRDSYAGKFTVSSTSTTFTGGTSNVEPSIYLASGSSASNIVVKPMIRLSSVSDATFAPYSNICPISGWTGANVSVFDVNVWDEEWENGIYSPTTGEPLSDSNYIRSKNKIAVISGTEYYVKKPSSAGFRILYYDNSDAFISSETVADSWTGKAVTIPSNAKYVRIYCGTSTYNHNISINYPSTDHDYHAYKGNTYTVDWTTEAGTVYGGTLDVTNGVLTVTNGYVDLGTLTWAYESGDHSRFYANLSNIAVSASATTVVPLVCSIYVADSTQNIYLHRADNTIGSHDVNHQVWVYNSAYSDASAFKTAMSGVQLAYPLATPVTYQLTPKEVATILGQNNIFCDTGNINELTYRADLKAYIDAHVGS